MAADTIPKNSWVQKTPGVCGGDACIRNTRITVHGLVHYTDFDGINQAISAYATLANRHVRVNRPSRPAKP